MAPVKMKPGKEPTKDPSPGGSAASIPVESAEVMTLRETAAYLRISEDEVLRTVDQQELPGRLIGTEWRFLKSALQDWLRTPAPRVGKEAVLARIGSWQGDPHLEEELEEIHKSRGRPTVGRP